MGACAWLDRMTLSEELERVLPGLRDSAYSVTSGATERYNCIAWALGETEDWWAPVDLPDFFWPAGLDRVAGDEVVTLDLVTRLFDAYGFERCPDGLPEEGVEKVALFGDDGEFLHVARQLPSGRWTSKLGQDRDIEHELEALLHPGNDRWYDYVAIVAFVKRDRR